MRGAVFATSLDYNTRGDLAVVQYPVSGATIAYTYDALRQIDEITELGQGLIASYDYRGLGQVERRTLNANGTRTDYAFDGRGRTIGTTHLDVSTSAVFDDRAYTWDRVSNKLTRTRLDPVTGLPVLTHAYEYDGLDRLETATRTPAGQSPSATSYALDPSGNRTSVAGGPDAGAYTQTQPPGSRVHEYASTPVAPYTRSHDGNGNFLGGQPGVDETLNYDAFNRIVGYSGAGGSPSAQYTYDAFGRRIQKIVVDGSGAATTRYVYHGDRVIEEMNEAGTALVASYVYGNDIDEVLRMRRDTDGAGGPENYYYHQDDLFNVVALTDQTGAVVERYDYGDYGAPEIYDAAGAPRAASAYDNTRLFQGRDYDAESGLYYFRARYLDPLTGRFTSRDPLGIWADVLNLGNGYTYAGNNPWSMRDPFGLASQAAKTDPLRDMLKALGIDPEELGLTPDEMLDLAQILLDVAALVPIVGLPADIANALASFARGDIWGGVLGLIGAVPGIGEIVGLARLATKMLDKLPLLRKFGNAVLDRIANGGRYGPDLGISPGTRASVGDLAGGAQGGARRGIYEFPDQQAGGKPYVGESGEIQKRLSDHERAGRLTRGTEKTTAVDGDRTAREIAEHRRIQEITGGVPARQSQKVSNQRDPIGPRRRHLLEDEDQ